MTPAERRQQLQRYRAHYEQMAAEAKTPAARRGWEHWISNADRALARIQDDEPIQWVVPMRQ